MYAIRSYYAGTDAAFMLGLINVITTNGWEDKEFIRTRVAGYEELLAVVKDYTPEEVVCDFDDHVLFAVSGSRVCCLGGRVA